MDRATATMPPITSAYTRAGTFIDGTAHVVNQENNPSMCPTGRYPVEWWIDRDGAARIREGEIEHCRDFRFAFDRSLGRFAAAVNALAQSGRTFPSEAAARRAVERGAGVPIARWTRVFECLALRTCERDVRWHTPQTRRQPPRFPDCRAARVVIHGGSLPEVGRHSTPSVVRDCGEDGGAARPDTSCRGSRLGGAVAVPTLRRFPEEGPIHAPIVAAERRRMGLPESGIEDGRRVGPTAGQIIHQYSAPAMLGELAGTSPWQLAQVPAGRFALIESAGFDPVGPRASDYARAAQLARAVLTRLRLPNDLEAGGSPPVGEPVTDPARLALLDQGLARLLARPGVSEAMAAPGVRPPPRGASGAPSLAGRVRIARNPIEYAGKFYELMVFVVGVSQVAGPDADARIPPLLSRAGIQPGPSPRFTPQERRLATLDNLARMQPVPAFTHPFDGVFYLPPGSDVSVPTTAFTALHETGHLVSGHREVLAAFQRRYGTRFFSYWSTFNEGVTDLLAREAALPGQRGGERVVSTTTTPGSGRTGAQENTLIEGPGYGNEVRIVTGIIQEVGRAAVLRAYFTGEVPARIFEILERQVRP